MRLLLKFVHVLGAMLFIGASASFIALASFGDGLLPGQVGVLPQALAFACGWIALPALVTTLSTGAILMAQQPAYVAARWAWSKAAIGLTVLAIAALRFSMSGLVNSKSSCSRSGTSASSE